MELPAVPFEQEEEEEKTTSPPTDIMLNPLLNVKKKDLLKRWEPKPCWDTDQMVFEADNAFRALASGCDGYQLKSDIRYIRKEARREMREELAAQEEASLALARQLE